MEKGSTCKKKNDSWHWSYTSVFGQEELPPGLPTCNGWCRELLQLPDQVEQADWQQETQQSEGPQLLPQQRNNGLIHSKTADVEPAGPWQGCGGHSEAERRPAKAGHVPVDHHQQEHPAPWAASGTWCKNMYCPDLQIWQGGHPPGSTILQSQKPVMVKRKWLLHPKAVKVLYNFPQENNEVN